MIHKLKENECRVIDISDRLGNDDIDFDEYEDYYEEN